MKHSKAIQFLLILFTAGLLLHGCGTESEDTEAERNEGVQEDAFQTVKAADLEGIYFVHGTFVDVTYGFPWTGDNIVHADTANIAFAVTIRAAENKPDTLEIYGLYRGNTSFYNYEIGKCRAPLCAYAYVDSGRLNVDVGNTGGTFSAEGTIDPNELILQASFKYRGMGEEYSLQGKKAEIK